MEGNRSGFFRRFMQTPLAGLLLPLTSATQGRQTEALVRHMMREARQKEAWDTPLAETSFVVVDTETTGFDPQEDVLLSIATVEMTGSRVRPERQFQSLIRLEPRRSIPPRIVELTGIREEDVADAPPLADVIPRFLQAAKGAVLVAHHALHDVRFLNAALTRLYRTRLPHRVLDSANVARRLHPELAGHTLDDLLAHFRIPVTERHTALGDARMTAELWRHLLAEAEAQGVRTLGELYERLYL